MMFFPAPIKGNVNGVCQCKRLDDENPLPLVHNSATDRCYPLYKQGYCNANEWLVYSESGIPKCQVNPCKDSKIDNVVLFEGECVELFESHPNCTALFPIIGFGPEMFEPICTFEIADKVLLPKGNSTCKNGFKFVGSRCRKVSSS
ncbi:unnamed protein product [Allacma fusca]|uniref:DUF4789 domain-containing protein n=1 Tax=Allacma fusca TaxID=39272 RepID=A0A8J2LEQ9_9HEXA|nr:unnamed protein product [Allacma fusca]